jgi:2,3-diketo-5-methylthio-1-phosphopentane phosphatase
MIAHAEGSFPDLSAGGWAIACDFDGTVTPFDVTDAVLDAFADKGWEVVEQEWDQGKITARQCMERQIGLLEVQPRELDAFLDRVPLTEGFPEFVAFCHSKKLNLRIVSDGMDYAIKRVLARHGLGHLPVLANRLIFLGGSRYSLAFPHGSADCPSGMCKCRVMRATGRRILLIGDGSSDCCLAGEASFILARRGLKLERHCAENQYPCRVYDDFFDIRRAMAAAF